MTDPVPNLGNDATATLFDAIDHAVAEAEDTASGFVPFVLAVLPDGEKVAKRYVDDEENFTVEGSVALARQDLAAADPVPRHVALAWDGFLTLDEDRTEAVFVDAYEQGRPEGVRFAQRYLRGGNGLELLGNPLLLNHRPEPMLPLPTGPAGEATDARAAAIARIQALADRQKRR
ncbi:MULTISPECIES: hypothetical protein [Amycolatopsis]|uniref:hypothetical protein n=1 Tax=Amycolatopsis TaxID=1813 RepID=UPI000B8B6F6F|nr:MULTISPECIES: hypothetical protein [Amycolatopsis]OXM72572.1 hypothetical protein CF166_14475 [Amycolatopsis sp. KNN50.9b]